MAKFVTAAEAVSHVADDATLVVGGSAHMPAPNHSSRRLASDMSSHSILRTFTSSPGSPPATKPKAPNL